MRSFLPPVYIRATNPDAFEQIVGVPLDDWMAANTFEAFEELLARRAAPVETLARHEQTCEQQRVEITTLSNPHPESVLCRCGAAFRRAHQ